VRWDDMARGCHRQTVRRGVAAICRVPTDVTPANPMTVELELRLGDDYVDTTTLGAEFQMKVLADQGKEEIHLGAGDDWVNGYLHRDRVWGGAGNDFIRGGEGGDLLRGEAGNDELVGLQGDDTLYGDEGVDQLKCGDGNDDAAESDPADSLRVGCERVPA
jgi:serralysin